MPLLPPFIMNKLRRGSSLLQNPNSKHHNLLHKLRERSLNRRQEQEQKRQDLDLELDLDVDSLITEVVQTVSLIQLVDAAGNLVEVQTVFPPPTTALVDPNTGVTVDLSVLDAPLPTDVAGLVPDLTVAPDGLLPGQDSLTSTPSSTSSAFPTLSGPFNVTNGWNGSFFANSSVIRSFRGTAPVTLSFSSTTSAEPTEEAAVITDTGGDLVGVGGYVAPAPTEAASPPALDKAPPVETSTVVGSVVGSVAGAALLLLLVSLLIKWRKRQSGRIALGDGPPDTGRGLITGGGQEVSQPVHRPLSLAVPAVLATLSGLKQKESEGAEKEKGFYRVAGRKLPSVLIHGGDGYNDPRASVMSGASSLVQYRDSNAFFDPAGGNSPMLALGSPMRPISGIPVMRSGPARTPVTEDNPFSDPPTPTSTLQPDPIGRSLTSQDGSRSSRFAEGV